MKFVYLDEFGHIGPYIARDSAKYNESPVFGLAGIMLPESGVRLFATKFLQIKEFLFDKEIKKFGRHPSFWEKKGASIFNPKSARKYRSLREGGFRLLNALDECQGKVFYYGREKIIGKSDGSWTGMYTSRLREATRSLNGYFDKTNENFAIIVDEHDARNELLEAAAKTMFGDNPARRLVSPPFEAKSHLNQNIQAADWVAAIVGRLWNYNILHEEFSDHEDFHKYYWDRVHKISVASRFFRRNAKSSPAKPMISNSYHQKQS